jgi:Ca2+-binding EF-hand superfamily protein
MTKLTCLAAAIAAFATLSPALSQPAANLPDGPITRAEVIVGAKRQFAAMDANHDGVISHAEFDAYRAAQAAGRTADGLFSHVGSHWFDKADANGDGRVTPEEAGARPLQMFDMADANHDGTVSPAERRIALMMMSLGK